MTVDLSRDEARFVRPAHLAGVELVSVSYRQRRFPVHTHAEFVVGAVIGGAETLQVGARTYIAGGGATLFLHPDEPHANATIGEDALRYRVFYLTAASLAGPLGGKLPTFAAPVSEAPHMHEALTRAHAALSGQSDALEQESAFAALAQTLIEANAPEARSGARPSARTRRVKAFIDEHFAEGFGLAALASISGMSSVHTLRMFKQEIGVTPLAYRNQVRLAHARRLLRDGHAVADTAAAVGFVDQSHLNRQFQRVVGISPARYARQ
ncbi:AraC family transcriptional regulator [Terricaulis sp.]|uniref:AraC family transcriptional regulator n=1 Tax=Terricaulis sp. TaxID=2768686 RepID=UPI002AC4DCD6|nr:AraC family transcriptional regulator [Terricaulis sp.]MDZ4690121.1 AraC family transcriptional regulator [Terricaulis sp.]